MTTELLVVLDDLLAGTLERSGNGKLRFEYDDDYQARPNPTPLSLSMPTEIKEHPDHAVTPWLRGLLPDDESVLRRWSREFQVSPGSPFSILSTPVGEDCAGAVRFVHPEAGVDRSGEVDWLSDGEISERMRELKADHTAWLGSTFTGHFSLAGAQAKTALLLDAGRWGVPSGKNPTTHILKPAVAGLDDHDLNEHLCLAAADRAGLIVARTSISRFGDETALIVERYDRTKTESGQLRRVHQEDFCQALGINPNRKYQNEGGPTPVNIATLLRRSIPPTEAEASLSRFVEALAWNWIIGGTDAHAKNYSLLLAGDQVRLAPLYDVASALPYGTHERKLRLAMKTGGSCEVYTRRNPWPKVAKELGLKPEELIERVRELAEVAPRAFAEAAAEPQVKDLDRELPGRLADLVAERSRRCVKLLET